MNENAFVKNPSNLQIPLEIEGGPGDPSCATPFDHNALPTEFPGLERLALADDRLCYHIRRIATHFHFDVERKSRWLNG